MNRVGFKSRLGAAVAAFGAAAGLVWTLSSYAYPEAAGFQPQPLAHYARPGACS